MPGADACFLEIIERTLAGRTAEKAPFTPENRRHAAVLIPLFIDEGECRVLFTKRTETVEHHKGEISFPGGAVDENDSSFRDTALRETYEEIGLEKDDVLVLGGIDPARTTFSNFVIHPYVGLIPYPYDFVLSADEVERLVTVPLRIFHPGETAARGREFKHDGEVYHGPTFTFNGKTIWGATAKIMDGFMSLLGGKIPLRPAGK